MPGRAFAESLVRAATAHGSKPAPPDHRPYRDTSAPGHTVRYIVTDKAGRRWRQEWRQVGWHGQSGAFYALGEVDPAKHEPGSYGPMFVLAHVDEVTADMPAEPDTRG